MTPGALEVRTDISPELEGELRSLVLSQRTLEDVVRWGLGQTPPVMIRNVVVQDEYTHDVVVPHPSGVVLVYDTT
ncbi:MAG: hypothetical protein KC776_04790 [Myxococcales bacterium]|nr:hypothetical protein [Myxococcales bacterium]MCB9581237.1 hypothetical protein [Polyangiaceae bacterium]